MVERLAGARVYIDTNVFICAVEGHSAFSSQARAILDYIAAGSATGYASELTLAELLVMPLRTNNHQLVRNYEALFDGFTVLEVVALTRPVLRQAAEIRAASGQKLPDCIQVAAAQAAGCAFIVSEDRRLRCPGATLVLLSELDTGNP